MDLLVLVRIFPFETKSANVLQPAEQVNEWTGKKHTSAPFQWFSNNDWFSIHSIRWNLQLSRDRHGQKTVFIVHLVTKFALISRCCKFRAFKIQVKHFKCNAHCLCNTSSACKMKVCSNELNAMKCNIWLIWHGECDGETMAKLFERRKKNESQIMYRNKNCLCSHSVFALWFDTVREFLTAIAVKATSPASIRTNLWN